MKTALITGGAGFVGSALAVHIKKHFESSEVLVLDNLKRRGSELNLQRLKHHGINFIHGDIRNWHDLDTLTGNIDCIVEASAEPSVSAGLSGSPRYLIEANLVGALNCLEIARKKGCGIIFLSTSRVYAIDSFYQIPFSESETRFEPPKTSSIIGLSEKGITEKFDTSNVRSLYGATKLSTEHFIQEYNFNYDMPAVINRCGVITGPGQFGKVDQGVYTFWIANHVFNQPLSYTGFGGEGKQVRDLLHIDDLCNAIIFQLSRLNEYKADIYNIGGGLAQSTSLKEYTNICAEVSGIRMNIGSKEETVSVDIPWYVSDHSKFTKHSEWRPQISLSQVVEQIHSWIKENATQLKTIFYN